MPEKPAVPVFTDTPGFARLGAAGAAVQERAQKRSVAEALPDGDGDAQGHPAKRLELGNELPESISPQEMEQLLDQADAVHIEAITQGSLKRMVMQLERKIKRNQELRIMHADEPDKFLKTEVDLDEEIKKFSTLAAHPELYGDLVSAEALPMLVGLLNHTNTDIAVDVFEVLSELTDADVIAEVAEPEAFLKALFDAQLCQMAVDVLLRIDESASDEDAQAVTNCLSMIENLADISPTETCDQFAQIPKLLPWLIKRVRAPGDVDYNRVYAAEILGIILQNSALTREAMVRLEGVDKLLRGIAVYRKRDPADNEEAEFVQNVFDCLCSLMLLPAHQTAFGKVQGLELMIRMMREHIFASSLALRLADHALRHCPTNCQIFVEKLGLKVLFAIFMKKGPKVKSKGDAREMEEHVTSIIQSLCRYCTGTPVARVLNKFMECQFEKLERLLELHEEYARTVRHADAARMQGQMQKIDRELEVDEEEQLFLDRCDAGLFTLQQVDIILVRLSSMGNREASETIVKLMATKGVPYEEVCDTLEEYCTHLGDGALDERSELRLFTRALMQRCGGDAAAQATDSRPGWSGRAARAVEPEAEALDGLDEAPSEERETAGASNEVAPEKKQKKETKDNREKKAQKVKRLREE